MTQSDDIMDDTIKQDLEAMMADPNIVRINMLRGTIAWTPETLRSVLGEPDLSPELTDAWRIIQALHSERMDGGESWPRALEWLERNERFRPNSLSSDANSRSNSLSRKQHHEQS